MKLWEILWAGCILFCLLAGCSARRDLVIPSPEPDPKQDAPRTGSGMYRDLIVLLPGADGKGGAIRVTTQGGSQVLDQAGYATQVAEFSKSPTPPQPMDEKEITRVFGTALSAQPDLTSRFASFTLWFENNRTNLTHDSKQLLTEIIRTINNRKTTEIYVAGHTDRVGTEEYNLELSSRRAFYIRDFFIFSGIKASDLIVSYHGEAMPLVYTEDEVPETLNRRVEVIVR